MALRFGEQLTIPTLPDRNRYSNFISPSLPDFRQDNTTPVIGLETTPVDTSLYNNIMQSANTGFIPNEIPTISPVNTSQSTINNPYTKLIPNEGNSSSYLTNLASVESSDSWTAHNKGSGAYGKYQFIPSTEKAYAKKLGLSIKEARTPAGQTKLW